MNYSQDSSNQNIILLKPLKFGQRIRKYILIPFYLNGASEHGNLKEALLKMHMAAFDMSFNDKKYWKPEVSKEQRKENMKKIREEIEEKNRKNINEYLPILFNQALVMACTVFDNFLLDSIKVFTSKNPQLLKSLVVEGDINIYELIDLGDFNKIFSTIQTKVLNRFDFSSIEEKIKLLRNRLKIDTDSTFKLPYRNQEVQKRYPEGYKFLMNIYKNRNDIVHRDKLPLRSYEELENISTFFDYYMLDFALIAGKKFEINSDFELFMKNPKSVSLE